ncbi:hypothetical protein COBT_001988, partial [Conglomerata obtusa]
MNSALNDYKEAIIYELCQNIFSNKEVFNETLFKSVIQSIVSEFTLNKGYLRFPLENFQKISESLVVSALLQEKQVKDLLRRSKDLNEDELDCYFKIQVDENLSQKPELISICEKLQKNNDFRFFIDQNVNIIEKHYNKFRIRYINYIGRRLNKSIIFTKGERYIINDGSEAVRKWLINLK